jgi:hypothetical protein
LTKEQLLKALREKVEVKIPVSIFVHFGLNSCIEFENDENKWFEKIFKFYSTLELDPILINLG